MSVGSCSKHDTRGGGQFSINEQLTVDIFFDASLHFNKDTVHYIKKLKKNTPMRQNLQFYTFKLATDG